jgi:two-component system response regulator
MNAPPVFPPAQDKLVLLVEDNADDEALTLRALSRDGIRHRIDVTHDGVEALDYLFARGPHAARAGLPLPAVTLLDLKLPRVDGLEVLRQVRADARTRHLPVVILTSSREDEDLLQSYGLGANSYIRKPVDFVQFTEAVRQIGNYWLVLNEDPPALSAS